MSFEESYQQIIQKCGLSPTSQKELEWLYKNSAWAQRKHPDKIILESGTLKAASTASIAAGVSWMIKRHSVNRNNTKIHSVDNYSDYNKNPTNLHSAEDNRQIITELGYADLVEIIEDDDIEYLSNLPDHNLSMYFIDSWHAYEHVSKLLSICLPKMSKKSLLCLHDYTYEHTGVIYAVEEFWRQHKDILYSPVVYESIWWCVVP